MCVSGEMCTWFTEQHASLVIGEEEGSTKAELVARQVGYSQLLLGDHSRN